MKKQKLTRLIVSIAIACLPQKTGRGTIVSEHYDTRRLTIRKTFGYGSFKQVRYARSLWANIIPIYGPVWHSTFSIGTSIDQKWLEYKNNRWWCTPHILESRQGLWLCIYQITDMHLCNFDMDPPNWSRIGMSSKKPFLGPDCLFERLTLLDHHRVCEI